MTKKKENEAERQTRARYSCPAELSEIINEINLVPPRTEFKDWRTGYRSVVNKIGEERKELYELGSSQDIVEIPTQLIDFLIFIASSEGNSTVELKTLKECIGSFPSLISHLLEKANQMRFKLSLAYPQNDYTQKDYMALVRIYYESYVKQYKLAYSLIDYIQKGDFNWELEKEINKYAEVMLSRNRRPYFTFSGIAAAINEASEIDRLRVCEVCERVFWAVRKDSKTCSAQCANRLRVRNYRNLSPEEKVARRERQETNRQLIKTKKAKRQKNGK